MSNGTAYARWSLEPYCIGMKLRALRTQKRLTLARLASETGLSTALLSKLETDRMMPTLQTLATICRVYGVGLSHFFGEPSRHSLSITRRAHLQNGGRGPEGMRNTPLNATGRASGLEARVIELSPGGAPYTPAAAQSVRMLAYVLEGRLQMDGGGLRELLETGDCFCLDSDMALSWTAAGKHRCCLLAVSPTAREQD